MPYIPHTPQEVDAMLQVIGAESIADLFDEIPASHRAKKPIKLPAAMGEQQLAVHMDELAKNNLPGVCFIGGGFYDHAIPAAVWQTASRGEFYSAYTPYQAEVSQGTLQTTYEYQSMITELCGLPVSNASLYDASSALGEAVLMACRQKPNTNRILYAPTLHPYYLQTAITLTDHQHISYTPIKTTATGQIDPLSLEQHD